PIEDTLTDDEGYDKEEELSVEERHWKRVFAKAFETVDCPEPRDPSSLPTGYYKGQMIDTHVHIFNLPGGEPGHSDEYYSGTNLGIAKSMEEWVCMLRVEGSTTWGFFPVAEPVIQESIDVVKITLEKYPNLFVPFITTAAPDGNATVVAAELEKMLQIEPGLFKGYGEIGLYSHGDVADLPPDSLRLTEIYPVVREHNLVVYYHPGFGHKDALEKAASANRDITFIFHGGNLYNILKNQAGISHDEKILADIEEILNNNPNVYYGVDELYRGDWLLEPGNSKAVLERFSDYDSLLELDLSLWKGFIERHPDQVLWGTDRGVSASWDKEPDVALTLNNYTRVFIDRLDPLVQEKFAYRNAERIIEKNK
ncbi:MAG: amidohydrolase family protein, partial [Nanoarchaeota archaeon]|nr:amidohydrolase family protein [Nanoarchaeota archaeon]